METTLDIYLCEKHRRVLRANKRLTDCSEIELCSFNDCIKNAKYYVWIDVDILKVEKKMR